MTQLTVQYASNYTCLGCKQLCEFTLSLEHGDEITALFTKGLRKIVTCPWCSKDTTMILRAKVYKELVKPSTDTASTNL